MDLGAVMDELAERLRQAESLAGRTFAYPPASIVPPAAIVGYPTDGTFDATYGRGSDTMTGLVYIAVGRPTDRSVRDRIAKYINGAGPESVKELLDGDDYESCDGVRVASWAMAEDDTVGGTDYLFVVFSLDIIGPGTT